MMKEVRIPQLVAHRGYLQHFPENSWCGLEAALHAGAPWLEFDVQLCADGGFVLLHDDNFTRTGAVDQSVFDLQSTQIEISVHEPDRLGEQFFPTPVATLSEVLHRLSVWLGVRAMVELKQESIDHWGLERVMRKLVPLLAIQQPQCVLISFNDEALRWCRQKYRDIRTGWVLEDYNRAVRARAEDLKPDYLICNEDSLPAGQPPWPGAWQWMLYDIVDAGQALNWAELGVDLIETAAIGSLLQNPLLKQRAVRYGL